MTPLEIAVLLCAFVTVFAFGLATLGLFRLPDFYARAHAISKADTLGTLSAVAGAVLALGFGRGTIKLLVLLMFVLVTTPTATHAIVRAASVEGYEPRTSTAEDERAETHSTGEGKP